MSHLVAQRKLTLDEVIDQIQSSMLGTSYLQSSLGPQLDRLRDGTTGGKPDPVRVASAMEDRMLIVASRDACVRAFARLDRIPYGTYETLSAFGEKTGLGEGFISVRVLGEFHARVVASEEAALAAVYLWMRSVHPALPVVDGRADDTVAAKFRIGRGKKARAHACALYGDARIAVGDWVNRWNSGMTRNHGVS